MRTTIFGSYLMFQAGVVQYFDVHESEEWFGVELPEKYANGDATQPLERQMSERPIGVRPLMSKRSKFSHQREYRFVLDTATVSDVPLELRIDGGMRDIAELTSIERIRETFKVSLKGDGE